MSEALLLSDDLIFTSRIVGHARAAGVHVRTGRDAATVRKLAAENPPALVLLDLGNPGLSVPDLLKNFATLPERPRVVAYGSHVDAEGLRAARQAGCDLVLPRSVFVEDLPTKISEWSQHPGS